MMKKKFYFYVLLAMVQTGLIVSCLDEHDPPENEIPEGAISVAEAKAFFEEQMMSWEVATGDEELHGFATHFTPQWEGAVINGRDSMVSVDVPIITDYLFKSVVLADESSKTKKFTADMPQKLIVVKNLRTGLLGSYVVSVIADKDYAESRKKLDAMDFTNYGDYGNFSGRIVYSFPLSNVALGVNRFRNGALTGSASVFDVWGRPEEFQAAGAGIKELLSGFRMKRKSRLALRSYELDGGWLDEVVITPGDGGGGGGGGLPGYGGWPGGIMPPAIPNPGIGIGGGGGGGGGGYPAPDPTPEPTDPCANGSKANTYNNIILTHPIVYNTMHLTLSEKAATGHNEWAIAIGRHRDGRYSTSELQECNATSGTIPYPPKGTDYFASGHSHTAGGAGVPSAGDLYTFLEMAGKYPLMTAMYVYGTGWGVSETYAINVHDKDAVKAFLNKYPKSTNWNSFTHNFMEGSDLANVYKGAIDKYDKGGYDNHGVTYHYMGSAVALSYIMKQFNMGVTLSRKVDNDLFKIINAKDKSGSDKTIDITLCQ